MTKMSAKRHLKELQWRFMLIALFFVVGAVLAFNYRETLMPLLLAPLDGQKLIYLTPGGGFTFTFLVAAYAGLALAFPILLHQLYSFLRPALPAKAQKKSAVIIISSVLLLVAGIVFGYLVAVPSALTFLYGFADQYVEASLTADSYINFVVAYTIGIGIVFQLPLLLLLLHAIKPQTPGGLMKSEKWVILIAFIIAALITPTPDPVNQAIIAGPVIVVYQIGVIAVLVSIARAVRKEKIAARKAQKADAALQELAVPEIEQPPVVVESPVLAFEEAVIPEPVQTPEPMTEALELLVEPEIVEPVVEPPAINETEIIDAVPIEEPLAVEGPIEQPISLAKQTQPKVIDGFVRRPSGPIQVPQRPDQPRRPDPRPIPAGPQPGPARGFYVDGIVAPKSIAIQ